MHDERHEHLEGLRRLFAGEASPAEADGVASHLMRCRKCWFLAARALAAQKARGEIRVQGSLKLVIDLLERHQAKLEEGLEAQALWSEMGALSVKAKRDRARLTRSLHTLGFLEVLLEEGTAAATPAESEEIFYLALLVAGQLPPNKVSLEFKNDLCAECCTEISNARRRLAKWPAASDALKKGGEYLKRGTQDRVIEGKMLCVAGALEDDLGNSEEAVQILRQALDIFRAEDEPLLMSRTLTQLAYILADLDPVQSLRAADEAITTIPGSNVRLLWLAETIRMNCLVSMGAPQEALLRLEHLKDLRQQLREPYVQLRSRFTVARILEHLGRPKRAESLFQEVIAGDLEHGLIKDFFLDLVYLLGFHLRRGEKTEAIAVCRRARQELSLLDDEVGGIEPAHDQMREVWRSLEQEIKKGTVGLGATTVLRNYIKAHWRTPASELPSFRYAEEKTGK